MFNGFITFFLDEKSNQKNHDYGSVASKLAKKAIVKELTPFRQPLLAPFFNDLLVAPPHYVGLYFIIHIRCSTHFELFSIQADLSRYSI